MSLFNNFWKGNDHQGFAYHSHAFHSYFEGYVERKEIDPLTGKTKLIRVYTGQYYVRSGSDAEWKRAKALAALAYLAAVAVFLISGTVLDTGGPAMLYQIVVALGFIVCFYVLYIMIKYLSTPRKMSVGMYKSFVPKLFKGGFAAAILLFASGIVKLVETAVLRAPGAWAALPACIGYMASGLIMAYIPYSEHTASYERVDNENSGASGVPIIE